MIDLTLDSLTVPGIPDYTPPFGTQKDPLVSLSTVETNNNIIKPFTAQRAIEFSHDETLSRIERNATLVYTGDADAVLDMSNVTTFKGNEIKIVNTTNHALTVKYLEVGEVSYSTMNLTENSVTLTADSTTTYSVKVSVESESITTLWSGTKEQFDAIPVKDSNTLYNIIDDVDEELIQDEKVSPNSTWSSERIENEIGHNTYKEKIFEPSEIVIHSINHRGANTYAPENTMSAFRISKELGFDMVECDVDFTADNVPVIIHDSTVDRTSNGTGDVHSFTFEDIRKLDFGSWKSTVYSGEKIPSFDEFILGCRTLGLHPYIEIKVRDYINLELVTTLVNIVHKYNMQDKVTWISFGIDKLQSVVKVDKYARVGFIEEFMSTSILDESINRIKTIDTGYNEIFYDLNLGLVNTSIINRLKEEKIKLEVWTVDSVNLITSADNYITGFTSNNLRADWVLRDALYADGDDLDFVDLTTLVQKTEYVDELLRVYARRKNGYVFMKCFCTMGDVPTNEKYHHDVTLVTGIPKKYIPFMDASFAAMGWGLESDGKTTSKVCRISVSDEEYPTPSRIRISESNLVKGDKLRAEWIYPVSYHRKNS